MNCREIQRSLTFYLDRETASSEKHVIQQHLAGCLTCQKELADLAATQQSARQALQGLFAYAEPSPQMWNRLQARMAEDARPSLSKQVVWPFSLAPGNGCAKNGTHKGDRIMLRRFLLPTLVVVVAISILGVLMTRNVTPVSAQQILERANAAQFEMNATEGIHHARGETYFNPQATEDSPTGTRAVVEWYECYRDLQSGIFRSVTTNAKTGQVINVLAYDGSYTYSTKEERDQASDALIIYRTPQQAERVAQQLLIGMSKGDVQLEFEQFRNNSTVEFLGTETWVDGRTVYVLRSQQSAKVTLASPRPATVEFMSMIFDAKTYRYLESRMAVQKDGEDIVVYSQKDLVDEILPSETYVAWDLSDLQGVIIVDDTDGEHGDLLPESITQQELAARAWFQPIYVLAHIPEGFVQEITAPLNQSDEQTFFYVLTYHNPVGESIVFQPGPGWDGDGNVVETYMTSTGLKILFLSGSDDDFTDAVIQAPDGTVILFSCSSLSLDQVKRLTEDLILLKK